MINKSVIVFPLLILVGCASEVPRRAAAFTQISAQDLVRVVQLDSDVIIDVGTGYSRMLPRGTILKQTGSIAEGAVYKPVNFTLTLEGANVHEVHLVLLNSELIGFYMPVEKAFVLPTNKISAKFSTRG